jgi:hypothetical protein
MQIMKQSSIKRLFLPVIALTLVLTTASAHAMIITYSFQGAITRVSDNLFTPQGTGSNGFNSGLQLQGTYQFDTMTPPVGNGNFQNAITSLNLTVGTYSANQSFGTNVIRLTDGAFDQYRVRSSVTGNLVNDGLSPQVFDLLLRDATGMAFSSNAQLPTDPPSLGSFNRNQWRLNFSDGGFIRGSITALQAVPLPAAVILFGAGLISLVGLGAGGLRNLRWPQA